MTDGPFGDESAPRVTPSGSSDEADITASGRVAVSPAAAGEPAGPVEPEEDSGPPLPRILEAILLVVDEPVGEHLLAQVTERSRVEVAGALRVLAEDYRDHGRGFELRQVGGGWRLFTVEDCAAYVERFVLDGQHARLTQAALETLAVIAYRQPVSRQSIANIRGVSVDGVVRTLQSRGLIAEVRQDESSGAHLYGTTPFFLERLGLSSLSELPSLAPLLPADLDEFESDL